MFVGIWHKSPYSFKRTKCKVLKNKKKLYKHLMHYVIYFRHGMKMILTGR